LLSFLAVLLLVSVSDVQCRQEIVVPSAMAASGSSKICEVLQESALIPLVTNQITQQNSNKKTSEFGMKTSKDFIQTCK
jgi:hypothetical protein